jgi:hypothetical protein
MVAKRIRDVAPNYSRNARIPKGVDVRNLSFDRRHLGFSKAGRPGSGSKAATPSTASHPDGSNDGGNQGGTQTAITPRGNSWRNTRVRPRTYSPLTPDRKAGGSIPSRRTITPNSATALRGPLAVGLRSVRGHSGVNATTGAFILCLLGATIALTLSRPVSVAARPLIGTQRAGNSTSSTSPCLVDDEGPRGQHSGGVRVVVRQGECFVRLGTEVPQQGSIQVAVIVCACDVVVERMSAG